MAFFLLIFSSLFAQYEAKINLPPRLQWEENGGYCGEVSFIVAGLYFGQYASQYDVRALVGNQKQELLLGFNDQETAKKMHLDFIAWKDQDGMGSDSFLLWVKRQLIEGSPVAIGVYMNQYRFYGDKDPLAGCPDYDHIVSVDQITSPFPFSSAGYHPDDRLFFSDHGLWDDEGVPRYRFSYLFTPFQGDRRKANRHNGAIYTLASDGPNYAIAFKGVSDLNKETLPVQIETSINYEEPSIEEGSERRPEPIPLTLTITVSNLEPNTPYILYRYDRFASVPDSHFYDHASQACKSYPFQIESGTTYTMSETILSNEIAVFRAVPLP